MKFHQFLLTSSIILTTSFPAIAQSSCIPFKVVEGEGYSVSKQVSTPGLIGRNNWNTDFVVPNQQSFREFWVKITSNSSENAPFSVSINLKYANGTADNAHNSRITLEPSQTREIKVSPRINSQPYQINTNIGGTGSIGFSYTVSVTGCP